MGRLCAALLLATTASLATAQTGRVTELAPPVRLHVGGEPIDTDVGHAAPFYGDFDGDGVRDLLVGQFGEGLLWIYRNTGSDDAPAFAPRVRFKDGAKTGRVPTG